MYGWGLGATGLNLFVRQHNLDPTSVLGLVREGGDRGEGEGGEGAGVNALGGLVGFFNVPLPPTPTPANEFYTI